MKTIYKDIRSMKSWLNRMVDETRTNDNRITFVTLTSLTPDRIAERIREHHHDPDDPRLTEELKKHYLDHPHPISKEDADDQRLISIILYIINYILTSKVYNRKTYNESSGGVHISTKVLRKLYHNGTYIGHVINVCLASCILKMVSERDTTLHLSRSFQLHPQYLMLPDNTLEIVECPDPKVESKILEWENEKYGFHHSMTKISERKVYMASFYNMYLLRCNFDNALAAIKDKQLMDISRTLNVESQTEDVITESEENINMSFLYSLVALRRMCSNDIRHKFLKPDSSNRIHSNLTSFPSILRKQLSFQGCDESLVMIDMSNAQPFLILNLVMEFLTIEAGRKIDTRKKLEKYCIQNEYSDIMSYVKVVEDGAFYKECYRLYKGNKKIKEITPDQKDKVRRMIYTSTLFGDGSTKWEEARGIHEAFILEYPNIWRVLEYYRSHDYKELANRLQREESKLFIDDVLTKLIVREKRPYILSLHDGILCPESAIPSVIEKFEHAFSKSKFQVKLKIDIYRTGETNTVIINDHKAKI